MGIFSTEFIFGCRHSTYLSGCGGHCKRNANCAKRAQGNDIHCAGSCCKNRSDSHCTVYECLSYLNFFVALKLFFLKVLLLFICCVVECSNFVAVLVLTNDLVVEHTFICLLLNIISL